MRVWGPRTLSSIIVKVNNSGYDVTVEVKLAKLALTHTGQVDSVAISPEGVVSWDEALGSTSYELRVMKDDQPFKTVIADATNTTTHQETREVFGDTSKGPTGTAKDAKIKAKAKTKKKENVQEYNLMSLVTVPGMYYVEVVPLNGLNSMIRVSDGRLWEAVTADYFRQISLPDRAA
ncbi:hypothetical protein SAMN05216349_1851 [Oribacterium sp. KHPX15]|uniref:hypothetical protein n=1 Tax=Oribacterium sp. KHPX15 TaxID=1855342 RepID=UPI000899B01A|nr:hypothetical protein [Oribacterium sp. KHPX15]SEA97716.1 hypothetical protein SAMN05216349_1851 [Oribacterium sp. KHPX15]